MTIFVHMKRFLPLVMGVCITAVSAQDGAPSLDLLKKYLTGSFTNAAQAAKDSTLAVIDLELRRIWLRDTDGVWLYEEQVLRGTKNTHLQGLHHLTRRDDSTWVLAEYRLDSLYLFAGAYRDVARFNGVKPSDTRPLPGCEALLHWRDGRFVGSTPENGCMESGEGSTRMTIAIDAGAGDLLWEHAVRSVKNDEAFRFVRKPRTKATMQAVGQ